MLLVQFLIDWIVVASWIVQVGILVKLKLGWLKLISLIELSIANISSTDAKFIWVINLASRRLLGWLKVAISTGGVPSVFLIFCRVCLIINVIFLFLIRIAALE
jgi:hypothetical protein